MCYEKGGGRKKDLLYLRKIENSFYKRVLSLNQQPTFKKMGRRNVQGGNKTKTMARNTTYVSNKIRIPEGSEEEFAVVTAVCGNGRFRIKTEADKVHMGVLPGSMKGHKKRNNFVQLNSIILINNRSSWQTIKEESTVDIEHIYSPNHIAELGLTAMFQKQLLSQQTNSNTAGDNVFVTFSTSTVADPLPVIIKNMVEEKEPQEEDFDIDLI